MSRPGIEEKNFGNRKIFSSPSFLILITVLTFGSCLFFPFIAIDDSKHIWQNPYVMTLSWQNIKYFWTAPYYGLYIPVTYNTWSLLALCTQSLGLTNEITQIKAPLFHGASLFAHLLNVYLLWLLFTYFVKQEPKKLWLVFFATVVFALHPLQVEAVVWASGLKDTLSASFILLATLSFLAVSTPMAKSKKKLHLEKYDLPIFFYRYSYFKFIFFSVLALFTKPIAVILPFALLAMTFTFNRKQMKSALLSVAPLLTLSILIMWLTKGAQPNARLEFSLEVGQKLLVALASLGFYISKIFVPYPLAPDYGLTPPLLLKANFIYLYFFFAAIYLIGLIVSFFFSSTRAHFFQLAFLLILFGFGPVLSLVPFEFQNMSTVADRYFYLFPAMGLGMLLIALTWNIQNQKVISALISALGIVTSGWIILSIIQTSLWENNERLFLHTAVVNPKSYLAYNNLGLQSLRAADFDNAANYFTQALNAKPDYLAAIANLGVVYFKKQDYQATIRFYQSQLAQLPKAGAGSPATYADMYFNLGAAYLNSQQFNAGVTSLKLATTINPDHFLAHYHLGRAYAAQGNRALAREELNQALRLQPFDTRILNELSKIK